MDKNNIQNNNFKILLVECNDCNGQYSYEDFQNHSKKACIENIKKSYESKNNFLYF
jgi:hypothetical protein